jgi:glycolate oxidase
MAAFSKVTPKIVDELRAIVGSDRLLLPNDDIEPYTHDETEDYVFTPEVVVKPASTDEVSRILKIAYRERIAVTPRAAGTSLSGGALPVHGGIVVSVEKMNKILEIDRENLVAVVQPGIICQVLQEEVEKVGLYYPPDPASRGSCMLGGNIAHNAGGPHALKYGVTKDWVLGLEAVKADGTILRTGGKLLKNVTGYNLTQLIVGSEGTLALVTQIILKLIPLPALRKAVMASFPTLEDAARAVTRIFFERIIPSACEFMERQAMEVTEKKHGEKFPVSGGEAALLIEVDGTREDVLDEQVERIGSVCSDAGALDLILAEDSSKLAKLWKMRRSIGEAVKGLSAYREEDCVVPRARLPELMTAIREVCARHGLTAMSYGHIGDGNVHVNILKLNLPDAEWRTRIEAATHDLFVRTVALGGMISGEHGIGFVQKNYLGLALSPDVIALMRQIKSVFDPNGILNPGKVFPDA